MSEVVIDCVPDVDGDRITVSVMNDGVFLTVVQESGPGAVGMGCVALDAAGQERFAQAYVAACHQAKVNAAQAVPR